MPKVSLIPASVRWLALPAALLFAAPASAGPLIAPEILNQFNLVVLGSMTSTSDVEGRAFVGGSLSGGEFNSRTTAPTSTYDELIVGGSISGNVKVQNGGDATVGGSGAGVLEMNAGSTGSQTARFGGSYAGTFNQGTKLENQSVEIPDFGTTLKNTSSELAGLSGSAPGTIGNKAVFSLTPDADGLTVYDIADGASFFNGINEIDFSLNGADTVVVNVGGTDISILDNFLGGPFSIASNVLWNFYEAASLTLGTQFFGSVLAPYATVTNYNSIEGTLVAGTFAQRGEVHLQLFEGELSTPTSEVPVPAVLTLILPGLIALGFAVARNRRANRRSAATAAA